MRLVGERGLVFSPVTGAFPAVGPHESLDGAARDVVALAAQPDPRLVTAQSGVELVPLAERCDHRAGLLVAQMLPRRLPRDPLVVGRGTDRHAVLTEHGAHGLDTPAQPGNPVGAGHAVVLVLADERDHRLPGRSS